MQRARRLECHSSPMFLGVWHVPSPRPPMGHPAMDSLSGFLRLFSTVVLYRRFMLLEGEARGQGMKERLRSA